MNWHFGFFFSFFFFSFSSFPFPFFLCCGFSGIGEARGVLGEIKGKGGSKPGWVAISTAKRK